MIQYNQYNFDWDLTEKDLCIFIPNYNRNFYINKLMHQFYKNDLHDYVVIIGNDCRDDISLDVKGLKNVYSFEFDRSNYVARNGAFIRNYFIKRCRSKVLLQKDPETLIGSKNDWISEAIAYCKENKGIWRPRYTSSLSVEQTNYILFGDECGQSIKWLDMVDRGYERMHFCYAIQTKILQEVRGYNQDFIVYGPEDRDMYRRLMNYKCTVGYSTDTKVAHLFHQVDPIVFSQVKEMNILFSALNSSAIYCNNEDWGGG
jgi:hypothetical protein